MNIPSRTRRKPTAEQNQLPKAPKDNQFLLMSPLPEPFISTPFEEPPPSGSATSSEVRTELYPPVFAPQTDVMSNDPRQNKRPVQIRWNSRKSRQDFIQQASDGPKSRFRHYNAERK
jgi:hypothetical protein